MPSFACKFTPDGLHGHLLAVSDEDGSVRLLDTRKLLSESSLSGEIATCVSTQCSPSKDPDMHTPCEEKSDSDGDGWGNCCTTYFHILPHLGMLHCMFR